MEDSFGDALCVFLEKPEQTVCDGETCGTEVLNPFWITEV